MQGRPSFATLASWNRSPGGIVQVSDDELFFVGPDGRQITLAHLPPRDLKDWGPSHKAMVVAAVRHGLITVDEACKRYNLSTEGYLCWYRCHAPQSDRRCSLDVATRRRWIAARATVGCCRSALDRATVQRPRRAPVWRRRALLGCAPLK